MSFFELFVQAHQQLTYALMKFYANALQEAEKRMRNLALMDVKGQVAETLLMLQHKFGLDVTGSINVVLTRQAMAAYAGTTYESFIRTLNELVGAGLIKQVDKRVSMLDVKALAALGNAVPD
ncbi:Crp/Fnr family transcriptional regulator [Spirosoma pomorum]